MYEIVTVVVKVVLLVNQQLVGPLCGLVIASGLRVLAGAALLAAGVYWDQYFDSPQSKIWHPNNITTGIDTGIAIVIVIVIVHVIKLTNGRIQELRN